MTIKSTSSVISSDTSSPPSETNSHISAASTATSGEIAMQKTSAVVRGVNLDEVFSVNVLAKILQVAERGLHIEGAQPTYPESVPQNGSHSGRYEHRDAHFWTCGFFPGSIYALLERAAKYPAQLAAPAWYQESAYGDLLRCGRHWSIALNQMAGRTDTHDMGFIIQPALQRDWELTGNPESRQSVITAAHALASRYSPAVGAIRSWDQAINDRYSIVDKDDNFLVIIDSMCNLDLLYYVSHLTHDPKLAEIATTHAHTVRTAILRPDFSSYHMVNFDPHNPGKFKARMTNQGHQDESTWTRGQAWSIMGFAQTYQWTRDPVFLDTAIACANIFLERLTKSTHHHPYVPVWDFDAPQEDPAEPLRDTSAGVIAANGMLLIHQALQGLPSVDRGVESHSPRLNLSVSNDGSHKALRSDWLDVALLIVQQTLSMSLDTSLADLIAPELLTSEGPTEHPSQAASPRDRVNQGLGAQVVSSNFDAILRNATANNNEHAHKRYWDHGLVYADYFLLEFGNNLCRMGFL